MLKFGLNYYYRSLVHIFKLLFMNYLIFITLALTSMLLE